MQPELIGALAGAGAGTFVGGLALYGALRQAHAARCAAEVAAEAAQQAAEHTVRAAYGQWRHASQRDAAVAFALAADDAVAAAHDLRMGFQSVTMNDEESAYRAMFRAFAVVRAEGPQSLIEHGERITDVVSVLSESAALYHVDVTEGRADPDVGWSEDLGACENDFRRQMHDFREAVRGFLDTPPADRPEDGGLLRSVI